ncbi:MAG: single-stranded-DNA-specific exonuclease RecJ [Alphaproteobacteria bacterium]|nr:single-stranded-DNA-specific exonuclease RecJ [Alphaproteobacteria bacterium]
MPDRSWTDALWTLPSPDGERVAAIRESTGLSDVAARVLALRFDTVPDRTWLVPSLDHLHDPGLLHDMPRALERLRRAVRDREKIRIITDYDVDGTTSSLILQAALKMVGPGLDIDYHIPNRFDEGYGFSVKAAEKAVEDGVKLIVTADIGVRDHASVAKAHEGGVDVLICDHHLPPGESVPEEAIVLCPPKAECTYPNPYLAACGVSLKLATALLHDHPRFDLVLRSLLKLAAIGTVADLVPLTSAENRAIVSLGLRELNVGRHHPGLGELLRVCDIKGDITETDLGFRVGPRINAAGRLVDAKLVVELLNCRDPARARELAGHLDRLNKERQGIQRTVFDAAMERIGTGEPDPFVVVAGPEEEGWHRGVVGIVASKVKDAVHRPVAVVSVQGDVAVGSVRSIDAVHAVRALDAAQDLLVRYGGHPAAAGFTVPTDRIDALRERLGAWVLEHTTPEDLVRHRRVDVELTPDQLSWPLFGELESLGPFGMKNPRPRLMIRGVRPERPRVLADGRLLKFGIPGTSAGFLSCVWWGEGERLEQIGQGPVDVLGQLGVNTWNGNRELQLQVMDVRDSA